MENKNSWEKKTYLILLKKIKFYLLMYTFNITYLLKHPITSHSIDIHIWDYIF